MHCSVTTSKLQPVTWKCTSLICVDLLFTLICWYIQFRKCVTLPYTFSGFCSVQCFPQTLSPMSHQTPFFRITRGLPLSVWEQIQHKTEDFFFFNELLTGGYIQQQIKRSDKRIFPFNPEGFLIISVSPFVN